MTDLVAQKFPVTSAVLIALAALPYTLMLAGTRDLHAVDGITRDLAAVYAISAAIILRVLLAALLILGGLRGQMPAWSAITAYIPHPCSGLVAITVHPRTGGKRAVPGLLILMAVTLPRTRRRS